MKSSILLDLIYTISGYLYRHINKHNLSRNSGASRLIPTKQYDSVSSSRSHPTRSKAASLPFLNRIVSHLQQWYPLYALVRYSHDGYRPELYPAKIPTSYIALAAPASTARTSPMSAMTILKLQRREQRPISITTPPCQLPPLPV